MKKESVRTSVKKAIAQHREPDADDTGDALKNSIIGLARRPEGKLFRCGDCEHFEDGVCHKDLPGLDGTEVDADLDCCNWFDCEGMERLM